MGPGIDLPGLMPLEYIYILLISKLYFIPCKIRTLHFVAIIAQILLYPEGLEAGTGMNAGMGMREMRTPFHRLLIK